MKVVVRGLILKNMFQVLLATYMMYVTTAWCQVLAEVNLGLFSRSQICKEIGIIRIAFIIVV
jgi:hypothetical protein